MPKIAFFMLFIGMCTTFAMTACAAVCRPLLIAVLKRRAKRKDSSLSRLMLAYYTGAAFDEVQPLLDAPGNRRSTRFIYTNSFIALALANQRFDEARLYADDNVQWLDAWLQQNRGKLRRGLALYQKWDDWRFSTDNSLSDNESWELSGQVSQTGGYRAQEWINAHLIQRLLHWSAQKNDAPAQRALRKLKLKTRPNDLQDIPPFEELAAKMGMLEADFRRLRKEQEEKLERIVYGEAPRA